MNNKIKRNKNIDFSNTDVDLIYLANKKEEKVNIKENTEDTVDYSELFYKTFGEKKVVSSDTTNNTEIFEKN